MREGALPILRISVVGRFMSNVIAMLVPPRPDSEGLNVGEIGRDVCGRGAGDRSDNYRLGVLAVDLCDA
jgi:hypothetical protein